MVDVSSEDTAGLEITNDKIKEVKDLLLNVLNIIQPISGKHFYHNSSSYDIEFLCVCWNWVQLDQRATLLLIT